jgi:hypothetical protein
MYNLLPYGYDVGRHGDDTMTPEMPDGTSLWTAIGGGVASLTAFALAFRRKLWRDKVSTSHDAAEVNIIESLQKERDSLLVQLGESQEREREAWAQRADAAALIGELTAQVRQQTKVIELLEARVESLRRDVHWLRNQLYGEKLMEDLDRQQGGGNGSDQSL